MGEFVNKAEALLNNPSSGKMIGLFGSICEWIDKQEQNKVEALKCLNEKPVQSAPKKKKS